MPNTNYKIEFADEQSLSFNREPLTSAVEQILTEHGILRSEFSIAIVDDPTIRKYNRQYLSHDYETDVISFVLEYDEATEFLVGQLIVSTDTASTMAKNYGGSMQDELLLYVIHGTLHLVGYDDKNPVDEPDMRAAEKKYLARFGLEHRWSEKDDSEVGP